MILRSLRKQAKGSSVLLPPRRCFVQGRLISFAQGLPAIRRRYFPQPAGAGLDHEDQAMQYDWNGVRTRRFRRLRIAMYTGGGLLVAQNKLRDTFDIAKINSRVPFQMRRFALAPHDQAPRGFWNRTLVD
jgi:hypothetical protein